ncbi:hypothetical protein [Paenibacillus sp. P36]|uniref:hypothetical protein n=1 Tax=Paenibacillus sp. P36 TaxID=3342538 RepID=UPI0038B40932
MGFCVKLRLLDLHGNLAKYKYGLCDKPFDGVFETDVTKVLSGELPGDTTMEEVINIINPCTGEGKQLRSAIQAFTAIYRHYRETNEYMVDGGYYS